MKARTPLFAAVVVFAISVGLYYRYHGSTGWLCVPVNYLLLCYAYYRWWSQRFQLSAAPEEKTLAGPSTILPLLEFERAAMKGNNEVTRAEIDRLPYIREKL